MKRTRSYIRYSSHNQDDGFSVEYQLAEIEEFVIKHSLELHKNHIDAAQTGTKVAGREAFFELIHAVQEGAVDVVVVYKLNRMFRNAYESQKYRKLFKKHGVKLMSVTQQIDEETSAGRLMTNVLSDIDQYQSETISDHVKSSMREMVRQGFVAGGPVPFGYTTESIQHGKKVRKKYVIHEEESKAIKSIFQYFADGFSLRFIQNYLADDGYLARKGKPFSVQTIARILKNDFYIGTRRYDTEGYDELVIENAVPAIIDMSLWHRVQERKEANKRTEPRKKKDLYALTGKIFCGLCGEHFFGMRSASTQNGIYYDYQYYICSKRKGYQTCDCNRIRKDYLQQQTINAIKENILNDESIKRLAKDIVALVDGSPDSLSKEIKRLNKRKNEIEKNIDTLLEMRLAGEMSADILKRKSVVLEAEQTEILNKLFALNEQQRTAITVESVVDYLNSMLEKVDTADEDILKNIFDNFVEKIVITNERVDVSLIVRPFGRLEYKKPKGHPYIMLSQNFNR